MENRAKKIGCLFLACFLVLSKSFYVKAEALPDVMSGSTTLADNIMSYYAMTGNAIGNTTWINNLYDVYGANFGTVEELAQQGYLVMNDSGMWEPVQELTTMIESVPEYTSLGLDQIFNVSVNEAATGGGYAAATGGSILAGSLGSVASTGALTLFGSVTAAYWGGIAIGTLAAHMLGLYEKPIEQGVTINAIQALNSVPAGSTSVFRTNGSKDLYYAPGNCFWVGYPVNNNVQLKMVIMNNLSSYKYTSINMNNGSINEYNASSISKGVGLGTVITVGNTYKYGPVVMFSNSSLANDYIAGLRNGTASPPSKYSPDEIGRNGNLQKVEENGQYTIPDLKPEIDPGTQAGKPLTLQDWLAFANGVNNNNNNSNPAGNGSLFQDIIERIVGDKPSDAPNEDPNQWSPPVVNPVPDPSYPDPVPDQPDSENPQESENPQQTEPLDPVDTGRPWMLPDLTKKFPFCIPWDIKDCFTLLKSNVRQAPHISWRFNPPHTPIDYTFNLDLTDFEPVATLLRTLELIAFIVGLAFVTRYIIGAS